MDKDIQKTGARHLKLISPTLEAVPPSENVILSAALEYAALGFLVLPTKTDKTPHDKFSRHGAVVRLRTRPLHKENIPYYFADPPGIALLTGKDYEVIDVDIKYDLSGKLKSNLLSAIKYTIPEVFDKLVFIESPTGGLHFHYKCTVISTNQTLAQRWAKEAEKKEGERKKVLIETRGEGGYIMAPPTPGYKFIKGDFTDISFITPDQRDVLLAICGSFNLVIEPNLPGIGKQQRENAKAPWNVYNADNDWQKMLSLLTEAGYSAVQDNGDRVLLLRPGHTTSKASGTLWKESNCLYLFSTSTEFPANTPLSAFDLIKYLKYGGDTQACARALSESGIGIYNKDEGEFHEVETNGTIKPKLRVIVDWLHDIGYRKHYLNTSDFQIVQALENRINIIDINHIKKVFCDYVHRTSPPKVDEYFLSRFTKIFTKEGLINLIEKLPDEFIVPKEKEAWFFYLNTAVQVTASDIRFVDYKAVPGYLWENNIIKRNISAVIPECEVETFIANISGDNKEAFECACGYLLHPFKDPANTKVVILNDQYFDRDNEREPEGGTGKGLLIQCLSKFRNTVIIDGKTFSISKNFNLQRVETATELLAIEDVRKGFDFESIFPWITDGMVIEKKNMQEFVIPRERSPKIIISSNYPIKGSSQSHRRRRFELELRPHYSDKHTIVKEFGHLFFHDWNPDEWNRFDNYFLGCVQRYLQKGLPVQETSNLEASKLISETSRDFVQWIDTQLLPATITKDEFMKLFTDLYPDYKQGKYPISQAIFTRWVKRWVNYIRDVSKQYDFKVDASNQYNGKMCYRFTVPDGFRPGDHGVFKKEKSEWDKMREHSPELAGF